MDLIIHSILLTFETWIWIKAWITTGNSHLKFPSFIKLTNWLYSPLLFTKIKQTKSFSSSFVSNHWTAIKWIWLPRWRSGNKEAGKSKIIILCVRCELGGVSFGVHSISLILLFWYTFVLTDRIKENNVNTFTIR